MISRDKTLEKIILPLPIQFILDKYLHCKDKQQLLFAFLYEKGKGNLLFVQKVPTVSNQQLIRALKFINILIPQENIFSLQMLLKY